MVIGDTTLGAIGIDVMVMKRPNLETLILSGIFHLINVYCVMSKRLTVIGLSEVQNTYQKMYCVCVRNVIRKYIC